MAGSIVAPLEPPPPTHLPIIASLGLRINGGLSLVKVKIKVVKCQTTQNTEFVSVGERERATAARVH